MEGIPALREIMEKNDYICKLDLKDAYVVVGLHPQSRKYLTFMNQGVVYQYKTLAFGMSVSPRVFSKMMRFAVEQLRKEGIRFVYYLDDVCLLAKTKEEMSQVSSRVINHLTSLGFLINQEKSILTPLHKQEFLGFVFNSVKMEITVPVKKINKLISRIKQALQTQTGSYRWYASLIGKMTSMIPAIGEALLHIRHLQRDLAHSLHLHHQRWEAPFLLSNNSRTELTWWLTYVADKNGLPIQRIDNPTPVITIHVDASDIAWGVSSPEIETTGCWTDEEKTQSINVRELSAILFALQLHGEKYKNKTIQ